MSSAGILICALLAYAGPPDAVLEQAASVDHIERLEQAVFGADEVSSESEMRWRVAWALLASGRDRAALRQFARLAGREPDAGGPKIGYALAAARLGDVSNAARAMRRVLRVDPDALAAVPMDESLHGRLVPLRTQYMRRLARFDHDRDGALMFASVCYLLGEADSARYAIGYLTANGDRGPTTENLDRLVNELANPPIIEVAAAEPPTIVEPSEEQPVDEPLDFTLVFRDEEPVPVPISAPVTPEVGDPRAPVSADSPPAPAPKPVAIHEVPERYRVDYDKLRDGLGSVSGALDTFTQKLIRNLAALQEKN